MKKSTPFAAGTCLFPLLYGCVIVLSLFLTRNCTIFPLAGVYDSLRYLGMTETMLRGEWLGDYNVLTLIRLPVYSGLMALNSLAALPLHASQQGLYLLSAAALAAALRSCGVGSLAAFMAFTACALHPVALYPSLFVATEAVYTSLATGVLAGCMGLVGSISGSARRYVLWLVITTVSLSLFWHTRPEGLWMVPVLCLFVLFLAFRIKGERDRKFKRVLLVRAVAAVLLPLACTLLFGGIISALNEKYYGVRVTHELGEPEFVKFGRWLTRLAPDARRPFVPVSSKALASAFDISPTTARLRPFFSDGAGVKGWLATGREWTGISDDLTGGWMVWALRDAADSIGMYESAEKARAFYRQAAAEIEAACRQGRVACASNPTGNLLAPFLTWPDAGRIAASFVNMSGKALLMKGLSGGLLTLNTVPESASLLVRYERITHDQKKDLPLRLDFDPAKHVLLFAGLHFFVLVLSGLYFVFLLTGGSFTVTHAAKTATGFGRPLLAAGMLALVFMCSRIGVVAYIDAMSFYAQLRYLLPVYPAFFALMAAVFSIKCLPAGPSCNLNPPSVEVAEDSRLRARSHFLI